MGHTEPLSPIEVADLLLLVAFVSGTTLGAFCTLIRLIRYKRDGSEPPELLLPDVVARVTLTLPFLAILSFCVFGSRPDDYWWGNVWIIGSGILAVIGVWVYVYYEVFIIER